MEKLHLEVAEDEGFEHVVATADAHYLCADDAEAHDVLFCINTGTIPSKTMREAVLHLSGFYYQNIYGINYRVKEKIKPFKPRKPDAADVATDEPGPAAAGVSCSTKVPFSRWSCRRWPVSATTAVAIPMAPPATAPASLITSARYSAIRI